MTILCLILVLTGAVVHIDSSPCLKTRLDGWIPKKNRERFISIIELKYIDDTYIGEYIEW